MWVSRKLREGNAGGASADLGVITIGGAQTGVWSRGEQRDLPVCAPGAVQWQPRGGEEVVVLRGGAGGEESVVLGVVGANGRAIEDGELYLSCSGASIYLRNNGRIELTGEVYINGTPLKPCTCEGGAG